MNFPGIQIVRKAALGCAAGVALMAGAGAAHAQVGVSISVNQPGVYGRIDIGDVPVPPVVVYQQPVVISPGPVAVHRRPIYLHVPPGHYKNWGKHCQRYAACGQPVYFVQENWYQTQYAPRHHPHAHARPDYRPQPHHARPQAQPRPPQHGGHGRPGHDRRDQRDHRDHRGGPGHGPR